MQASQRPSREEMSKTWCLNQPFQNVEAFLASRIRALEPQLSYSNSIYGSSSHPVQVSSNRYCTLESSPVAVRKIMDNSSSVASFLPNGSPVSQQASQSRPADLVRSRDTNRGSSISESCITDDVSYLIKEKLRELESVMLGPDTDCSAICDNALSISLASPENSWRQMFEAFPGGDLKQVLVACAKAVSENDKLTSERLMTDLRKMVSVSGEPIQRLGAYLLEGLVAKSAASGSSICKSLRSKEPSGFELLSYMQILHEVCPYFKFGYMSANGAIAEAMKDENRVHIIDFQIAQGNQWVTLIQAFAARPGGPPHIRITGIDDPTSAYARGGGLSIVGKRLCRLAESFKVPFEFHAAVKSSNEVQHENLGIQSGEALAVNFAFVLHHMPDESVTTANHRDRLLRLVKSLNPKVVTLVEHESNTNTAAFFPRFLETLDYYNAMFESIDFNLPREHKERINIEQHCLARDVVNIIACEGPERVERHELLGKWKSRFRMAGFRPHPLSSLVNATIKRLLENYCHKYRVEERDEALYLGWMDRDLVASCAWQ